jgi:histidinol dehydrogenase
MKIIRSEEKRFPSTLRKICRRFSLSDPAVEAQVRRILDRVREVGDRAVLDFTRRFDRLRLSPEQMRIDPSEIRAAYRKADPRAVESLGVAADRIRSFHGRQRATGWTITENGATVGQRVHPLDRVGLYVPGGKAAYPSSVLMNALPAKVAGVGRTIICSPTPGGEINPYLLVAADIAGVEEIYRIGGAQAIGALAFGTETIPSVDKIVGPGNRYVASAKRLVFGTVDIDMVAGPSELLIIADAEANPAYVASDLLSQAEHDEEAVVLFVTPSETLVNRVEREMKRQLAELPRKAIASASLRRHGFTLVVKDLLQATEVADAIAPEHLSLFVREPEKWLDRITHAGAVFLGEQTPQALGDYLAGPNHVLPTGGTARFFSPLSVDDFVRKSSVISYTKEALERIGPHVVRIAEIEGLSAHGRMVSIRMKNGTDR